MLCNLKTIYPAAKTLSGSGGIFLLILPILFAGNMIDKLLCNLYFNFVILCDLKLRSVGKKYHECFHQFQLKWKIWQYSARRAGGRWRCNNREWIQEEAFYRLTK